MFNVKSSINGNVILKKSCISKIGNFHFHNIKFLKLHYVKNIKNRVRARDQKYNKVHTF